jgi:deoxyribose-phosphate aldolase
MPPLATGSFAAAVDHTLLDAAASAADIDRLCDEACEHRFASVCVYPWWVARAAARLQGACAICTVIGFPHGLDRTAAKVAAVRDALAAGASEIDAVIAYGALRSGDDAAVLADARAVAEAVHRQPGALVKLIVESSRLDGDQLTRAGAVVAASGADFAKTSTGFAGGATLEAVRSLRSTLPDAVRIKASGGIRSAEAAAAMLEAGASRLGTSSAIAILEELSLDAVP